MSSKRDLSGILLLDKPAGLTSNAALQKVKRLLWAAKAGHTGSLDPLATGMLPLCFGEATKFAQYMLAADKTYLVTAQLGVTTTTADSEGEILETLPVAVTQTQLESILQDFLGETEQCPPMYSALKHEGQPLYRLARAGITVPRALRSIVIDSCVLTGFTGDTFSLKVSCSKGTYIRTLVEDIGKKLGCGAHLTFLRRLTVGFFPEEKMISLDELTARVESGATDVLETSLLPIDAALQEWPEVRLTPAASYYICRGQALRLPRQPRTGMIRFSSGNRFLGIGEVRSDGRIAPRRLIQQGSME